MGHERGIIKHILKFTCLSMKLKEVLRMLLRYNVIFFAVNEKDVAFYLLHVFVVLKSIGYYISQKVYKVSHYVLNRSERRHQNQACRLVI